MAKKRLSGAGQFTQILRAGHWFQSLDATFQEGLITAAVVKKLRAKESLFRRGDAPDGLYALADGALRVTGVGPDGHEAMLTRVEPPNWFGEISVFDGEPRTHDAIADGAATVIHVPEKPLRALLKAEPHRWHDLGRLVALKLRLTFEVLEEMAVLPLPARLARRLLLIAQRHGEWKGKSSRVLQLSQEQLALMLGTTRQTVNQLVKDLQKSGAIHAAYGAIEISDLAALKKAALLT